MHEYSTRAWYNRRQKSAIQRGFLAAVLVLGLASPVSAAVPQPPGLEQAASQPGPTPIKPAYDVTLAKVDNGSEALQLSARLAEDAAPLQTDLAWTVLDETGVAISTSVSSITQVSLAPGSYNVRATYGSAIYQQSVELKPGQRLGVSFLLNAGAMRVVATVQGISVDKPATNLIYASSGPDKGRLVTISRVPGEILRLPSGSYRLESRMEPGNAVLVTDVAVSPGIMSSVNVAHRAGLLRFSYAGTAADVVHWQIVSPTGEVLLELEGASASALLKPGYYRVEMQAAGQVTDLSFQLAAGEEKNLTLGR